MSRLHFKDNKHNATMRIAVNARHLISGKMEGIGWYSHETIRRMVTAHPEVEFHLLFDRPFSSEFLFADNVIPHVVRPPARHPILWYLWFEWALPQVFRRIRPDVFYSPDGYLSLRSDVPTLLVIHDLAFEHFPEHVPLLVRKYYRYFTPLYAEKAAHITAVSQATRKDIIERYHIPGDRISVAGNGVRDTFKPLTSDEKDDFRKLHTAGREYLFFVGAMHPRKNIARLIEAYSRFRDLTKNSPMLVLTGRMAWMTEDIRRAFDASSYRSDILFTGHLNSDQLADYTASASVICYLSLFEGFGVPVLEAMHAEVPLLCSNLSSIPEVAGNAAIYADPHSTEDMARQMLRLWTDDELRDTLVKNGRRQREQFSWDRTAELLWDEIMTLAARSDTPRGI